MSAKSLLLYSFPAPPPAKLFPVSICSFPRCWSPHVIIILYGVIMTFECSLKKTDQIYHTKHIWLNQSLDQISIKNIGTLIKESDNNEKRYLPLYCELKVLSSQCNSRWEGIYSGHLPLLRWPPYVITFEPFSLGVAICQRIEPANFPGSSTSSCP